MRIIWYVFVIVSSIAAGTQDAMALDVKAFMTKAKKLAEEKEKTCQKYCYHAFRSGTYNPLKRLASMSGLSTTERQKKCNRLCTGRKHIFSMNLLEHYNHKSKEQSNKDSVSVHTACLDHGKDYMENVFGWSCRRHCDKKVERMTGSSKKKERKTCRKGCKTNIHNYMDLATKFCTHQLMFKGSESGQKLPANPLFQLLHAREEDYAKPVSEFEAKEKVMKFYQNLEIKDKKNPAQLVFDAQDIAKVVSDLEEDETQLNQGTKADHSDKKKKRSPKKGADEEGGDEELNEDDDEDDNEDDNVSTSSKEIGGRTLTDNGDVDELL